MLLMIQIKDGRQYPFEITDGQASLDFLGKIKYWEVFDRPVLRIRDRQDLWTFNPGAVEKILFRTTEDPGWRPAENILSAKCISRETYERKLAASDARARSAGQTFEAGKILEIMLKITLASGAVDYFECTLMLKDPRDQQVNLYHLFQKVAYTIPCEQGGFILLNPAHIVCVHMHPSAPEDPDSVWIVDEYAGDKSNP